MSGTIVGYDQLPPSVRDLLKVAPINFLTDELVQIYRQEGEAAVLDIINRAILRMRPNWKRPA